MFKRIVLSLVLLVGLVAPVARAAEEAGGGEETPSIVPDMASKETYLSAMWVVIIFIIMLMILYPTAWRTVLAGLKKREERIRNDIAEAEAARTKSEALLKQYNE